MRAILAVLLTCALGCGAAWAGVVPNQGNQSMSGAKIKPPSHEPDEQASNEQAGEKKEAPKEDKR
jgi:hypothetical protein